MDDQNQIKDEQLNTQEDIRSEEEKVEVQTVSAEKTVQDSQSEAEQNNTEKASEESQTKSNDLQESSDEETADETSQDAAEEAEKATYDTPGRWYVVHTYSGHENKVAAQLKQRVESEGLENKIFDILVPTQDKIEIRGGKKTTVKEKIFPGYILVRMILDDDTWLAIRTTQGVTSFVGAANKPTPIPDYEVQTIIKFMQQGGQPTYKDVISEGDTVKIIDGPFSEMIGKATEVDKEKGKVKVMVSIFGRETPVELDFLQVSKL